MRHSAQSGYIHVPASGQNSLGGKEINNSRAGNLADMMAIKPVDIVSVGEFMCVRFHLNIHPPK